jgi:endoglucanase
LTAAEAATDANPIVFNQLGWPGLLPGGPNAHPSDPIGWWLPKRPPMQMYQDKQAGYSMNEIAINWNAPLVFLLASPNAR